MEVYFCEDVILALSRWANVQQIFLTKNWVWWIIETLNYFVWYIETRWSKCNKLFIWWMNSQLPRLGGPPAGLLSEALLYTLALWFTSNRCVHITAVIVTDNRKHDWVVEKQVYFPARKFSLSIELTSVRTFMYIWNLLLCWFKICCQCEAVTWGSVFCFVMIILTCFLRTRWVWQAMRHTVVTVCICDIVHPYKALVVY